MWDLGAVCPGTRILAINDLLVASTRHLMTSGVGIRFPALNHHRSVCRKTFVGALFAFALAGLLVGADAKAQHAWGQHLRGQFDVGMQAAATPVIDEDYESLETTWRVVPATPGLQVVSHERTRQQGPPQYSSDRSRQRRQGSDTGVEKVEFTCPAGYAMVLVHPIGKAPVIDDFRVSIDFISDQVGVQLAARVVLPRSLDKQTNKPIVTVVRSEKRYETPNSWATLSMEELPLLVKRQARILRATPSSPQIDERGAYIDGLVLVVPGTPEQGSIAIDRLTVHGVLTEAATDRNANGTQSASNDAIDLVDLSSAGFQINQREFYPRIWTYNGQAMAVIKQRGFNTVAFRAMPTEEIRAELTKAGLWMICPPPTPEQLLEAGFAKRWRRVLAWHYQGMADSAALDVARAVRQRLRDQDTELRRPMLAEPTQAFNAWSRLVDGLVISNRSSLYAGATATNGLGEIVNQVRPGTPLIGLVPTQHSPGLQSQLLAMAPAGAAPTSRTPGEVLRDVWSVLREPTIGLAVRSKYPLAAPNVERGGMSDALELANQTMLQLQPFFIGGARRSIVRTRTGREAAVRLSRERVDLLIPRDGVSQTEESLKDVAIGSVANAWRWTPVALQPVASVHPSTGHSAVRNPLTTRLFADRACLVLTEDYQAGQAIAAQAKQAANRLLQIRQNLAQASIARLMPQSAVALSGEASAAERVKLARQELGQSKSSQVQGRTFGAYQSAVRALAIVDPPSEGLGQGEDSLDSVPLACCIATKIYQSRLEALLSSTARGSNLLVGGDFEDIDLLRSVGWKHTLFRGHGSEKQLSEEQARVELVSEQAIQATRCLLMQGSRSTQVLEPTAWITTPKIALEKGQLVEITGWVNVVPPDDGEGYLTIADSLGGTELSLRVRSTKRWKPFRLLRRASEKTDVVVSFAVTGGVVARVDAVMARPVVIQRGSRRPKPQNTTPQNNMPQDIGQASVPVIRTTNDRSRDPSQPPNTAVETASASDRTKRGI